MKKNKADIQEDFRQAMRRIASTVSIITAECDGIPLGMTATSVTCVSFEPLSMLVCIHQDSKFYEVISNSKDFCINILHHDQQSISNDFSNPGNGNNQFTHKDWVTKNGPPHLESAQANLFVKLEKTITFGTHGIFMGIVTDLRYINEIAPLLYANGSYAKTIPVI